MKDQQLFSWCNPVLYEHNKWLTCWLVSVVQWQEMWTIIINNIAVSGTNVDPSQAPQTDLKLNYDYQWHAWYEPLNIKASPNTQRHNLILSLWWFLIRQSRLPHTALWISCLSVPATERSLCWWMGRQQACCQDHATHTHSHTHTHTYTVSLTHTWRPGGCKVSAFSRQNKGVWKGLGNYRRMCISVYTVELTWRQLLRAQFKSTTGRPCVHWAQLIVPV